jgi:hypothetical protein
LAGQPSIQFLEKEIKRTPFSGLLGLTQVGDRLLLRWKDKKQIYEGPNFEQAPDLSIHCAKGELVLPFLSEPTSDNQSAESSTADVGDVLEVDNDMAAASLDDGHQSVAKLLCSRAVKSPVRFDDGDLAHSFLYQIHKDPQFRSGLLS